MTIHKFRDASGGIVVMMIASNGEYVIEHHGGGRVSAIAFRRAGKSSHTEPVAILRQAAFGLDIDARVAANHADLFRAVAGDIESGKALMLERTQAGGAHEAAT